MALSDLVQRLSTSESERVDAAVERLSSERTAAETRLAEAQAAWSRAITDEAEGLPLAEGSPSADDLETRLNVAQRDYHKVSTALEAAQARQQLIRMRAAQAARVERWDRVEELDEVRKRAAARLAKSRGAYVADLRVFYGDTTALSDALPICPDPDAALLRRDQLEIMERQALARLGVPWAISTPWGRESIPEFMTHFENVSDVIHAWRAADLARAQR